MTLGRLRAYNESIQSYRQKVLEGSCSPDDLLPLGLPKDMQDKLVSSWQRCAKRGLDPQTAFDSPAQPAVDAAPGFSRNLVDLAASLIEKSVHAFDNLPCAMLLLDARFNTVYCHNSLFDDGPGWVDSLIAHGNLAESFCGTCAHTIVDRRMKSAVLIGSAHYCRAFDEVLSAAVRLEVAGSTRGYVVAFVWPDEDRLLSSAFQGMADNCMQILATAIETAYVAETRGSRSKLLDDILSNSLAYGSDAIIVVDAAGRLRSANARARQLLGFTKGNDEPLSGIVAYSRDYDLRSVLRSGRVISDVEIQFSSALRKMQFKCDIRPLLGRDRERVVGSTIRLRPNVVETDDKRPIRHEDLKGVAKSFLKAKKMAMLTAPTYEAVLITGGIGTGKRAFAKAMHLSAHGNMDSFAMVDCSNASAEELEMQLFGALDPETGEEIQGAYFTANEGTLVINAIDELPLALQGAIMRTLDSNELRRPGKIKPTPVRIKLVAINRSDNLQELMGRGEFREDLFYRLSTVHIKLPDLKDRREDILELASIFIDECCAEQGVPPITIAYSAKKALRAYSWPGNVAQLRFFIRHACYVCENHTIDLNCLPDILIREVGLEPSVAKDVEDPGLTMKAARRSQILNALQSADGNMSKAAKVLGVSRATLYRWKKEEGID